MEQEQPEGLSYKNIALLVIIAVACLALGASGVFVWQSARVQQLQNRVGELEQQLGVPVTVPTSESVAVASSAVPAGYTQYANGAHGIQLVHPDSWKLTETDGTKYFGSAKVELETSDDVGILVFDRGQAQVLFGYVSAAYCKESGNLNDWDGFDESGPRDSPLCNAQTFQLNGRNVYAFAGGSPGSFIYSVFVPGKTHGLVITDSLNSSNGEYNDAQIKELELRSQALVREISRALIAANPSFF